ncbi:BA14K family protein [Mesorhizobium sp. CN2-181]|uniref:BA14K family protein n=1 Tax=Mesorhizobium yinganensis TaxID=3157707 RepID=UPI0032B79899
MKLFLVGLSGFVLTLAIFATGAIFAVYFTTAEPIPAWQLNKGSRWTVEPIPAYAGPVERLPAKPSKHLVVADDADAPAVDMITTSAISDQEAVEPAQAEVASMAHMRWCSEHYRSYRPEDNSYRSYSGVHRECISPFGTSNRGDEIGAAEQATGETAFGYTLNEVEPTAYADPRHIASCFARYRSYNPEDNSYQPYGRGARRQCE